jgi:5-methylcytosine-specific restriction enzyme subunit McrC
MKTLGEGETHIPVRSLWFLLIYASDLLAQLRTKEREEILAGERDNKLIDAIAEVLVVEVERRLCRQLTVQYRPRRADLTRVRGRIDHLRTTTRRLSDQGRIACCFDELCVDSPRHRFIAHTLLSAAPKIIRPELAQRCRAAAFRMHRLGVSATPPSRAELSTDRLGHHDIDDRRMRDAALLLRDMAVPAHEAGPFDLPALRDDVRAHRKLFEAAVRGFFRYTLSSLGWDVQARILQWTPPEHSKPPFMPVMKTDVTLDHPKSGRRVVIEAKFTDALEDRDGKTTIATGYLYQLYSYLASQSGRGDHTLDTADGVLLFVKTVDRDVFDGEVTIQGHRIRFLSVDLAGSPAEIRARWMQCIQD